MLQESFVKVLAPAAPVAPTAPAVPAVVPPVVPAAPVVLQTPAPPAIPAPVGYARYTAVFDGESERVRVMQLEKFKSRQSS